MIGKLTGIITSKVKSPVIIDVHDVGYIVYVSDSCREKIQLHTPTSLYIHSHIREDAFDLFGFLDERDLSVFELLLTVSGIGPKTALGVINKGAEHIHKAVLHNDVNFFTDVPRLGKKNAQKIIIELKNKFGGLEDLDLGSSSSSESEEIMDALLSMGFVRREILRVIEQLQDSQDPIDSKIRAALRLLGKRS